MGRPSLLDFGIAKAADGSKATKTGTIQGTLQYMAPEVFSGKGGTVEADLYALGLSFVELLKGQSACPDASMPEQMAWHLMQGIESIEQGTIPTGLWSSYRSCARRKPQTVTAVRQKPCRRGMRWSCLLRLFRVLQRLRRLQAQ